jgi:hypothetical protein
VLCVLFIERCCSTWVTVQARWLLCWSPPVDATRPAVQPINVLFANVTWQACGKARLRIGQRWACHACGGGLVGDFARFAEGAGSIVESFPVQHNGMTVSMEPCISVTSNRICAALHDTNSPAGGRLL